MIKAILFDFGQTLVDSSDGFKQAEAAAKVSIFSELFPLADDEKQTIFLEAYRRIRKDFHDRSVFSRPAIWEQVYRYFDRSYDLLELEEKESRYWETVKQHTRPFPETTAVLEQLTDSYRVALITNTQGQKITGTHRLGLFPDIERFFDMIVVAGEAGMPPKPDAVPFLFCLKKLGINPAQAVYVGDDWRIDIRGSHDAGLQPVWLKHRSVNRNWPNIDLLEDKPEVPEITGLDQLPALVESFNG